MFKGSNVALVTPLKNGELDRDALKRLVEWHITEGTHGLVPVGTTGESPTLSHEEHEEVIKIVVETAAGRVPVIAGAGSNNTREAIRFTRHAKEVGANATLHVTPYYNRPTQEGLYAHFKAVAEAADLPLIIYNIPARSVVDMSVATMARLAKIPNVVGVKDATGDVARVSQQRAACGEDFLQLTGEDASALGHSAHGGLGCISVTANVAPRLCAEFQERALANDYMGALELQDRLMPLHEAIFREPGLAGAKYGLSVLGRCENSVRLPLMPVSGGVETEIRAAMVHAGLIN